MSYKYIYDLLISVWTKKSGKFNAQNLMVTDQCVCLCEESDKQSEHYHLNTYKRKHQLVSENFTCPLEAILISIISGFGRYPNRSPSPCCPPFPLTLAPGALSWAAAPSAALVSFWIWYSIFLSIGRIQHREFNIRQSTIRQLQKWRLATQQSTTPEGTRTHLLKKQPDLDKAARNWVAIDRQPLGLAQQVVDEALAVAQHQVVLGLQVPHALARRQPVLPHLYQYTSSQAHKKMNRILSFDGSTDNTAKAVIRNK